MENKTFVKNLEINYKIMGEGKPFLILHGWGSKNDNWKEVAEKLKVKVIIPDLPGFGQSSKLPAPWSIDDYCSFVDDFVKSLELDQFYLLGHSFGGTIAAKYSLINPNKIKKLFLVGASCIREKTVKKRALFIFSKIFKLFSYIPLFKKAFYKFVVKSDYPTTKGFMRKTYLNVIKKDLSEEIKNIKISTVIIWGDKDNVVPLKYGKLINSKIKNSKLIIIPEGSHDLERKMPKELSEIINSCF